MYNKAEHEVRTMLTRFQEGYTVRNLAKLDAFMELFLQDVGIELIGIGASVRGGNEWFQGPQAVREIIESDWTYWGDVCIDVEGAKITTHGDVAWLSTSGTLAQTDTFDKAMPFYVKQLKEILEDESLDPDAQLMEAAHFGLRRLRERQKGVGYCWPFVLTAVLVSTEGNWHFHTIHWSMPVD